jgi:hypothetical protein
MPTVVIGDTLKTPPSESSPLSGGHMEFTLMLFQAAIACLITLSVSVLITHAIDAFKT